MTNKEFAVYDTTTNTIISFHTLDEAVWLVENSIRGGISWCHQSKLRTRGIKRRG